MSDARPRLSDLVFDGVGHITLRFSDDGGSELLGSDLLTRARPSFSREAENDTVAAVLTNDAATVAVLLGALEAGVRLVSLPIPNPRDDPGDYVALIESVRQMQGAGAIFARDDVCELLLAAGLPARKHSELAVSPLAAPSDRGFELVQFSSGTTADPKGVLLTDRSLGSNVVAIIESLAPEPGDHAVSWLPLSHDMGLIGMLLTAIASASPKHVGRGTIALLDPIAFLRRPATWLEAISELRGTITAAPDFGYRLAADAIHSVLEFDLSRLRCAIVGGEIVRAATLGRFARATAQYAFDERAFSPAYGLAEIGLAATITPPTKHWTELAFETTELASGRLVTADEDASLGTICVSSGSPLSGYEIRCRNSEADVAPLEIRAPSIGADPRTRATLSDDRGWLQTGDLGATIDGDLYVFGRHDDYIVDHGRKIYAPAVEDAVALADGIRQGRVAAVGLPTGEWILIAETETKTSLSAPDRQRLVNGVRLAAAKRTGSSPSEVRLVRRGSLSVTTSGKLRRHEIARCYANGHYQYL